MAETERTNCDGPSIRFCLPLKIRVWLEFAKQEFTWTTSQNIDQRSIGKLETLKRESAFQHNADQTLGCSS